MATSPPDLKLSENARVVLERRYLAKDEAGNLTETPAGLFQRVAANIAAAERAYANAADADATVAMWEQRFLELMTSLRFLPNSPTLGNAGRPLQQLAACFVLPVADSIEGIFETVKQTALIHQSGGGTGFAFSRLRPAGDVVRSSGGVASGPVSFMKVFDGATEAIKQGGTRRGANMAILDVRHPDIEDFINVKADMVTLTNFNISVAVDEPFMKAVEDDAEYDLINPRTGEVTGRRRAKTVFDQVVANAWANGDPGLVFLDRINRDNPTPALGRIEATNPCGEQPLLAYESCNLGSLNLCRFLREGTPVGEALRQPQGKLIRPPAGGDGQAFRPPEDAIDWDALTEAVSTAVRFLDDVIDMNAYPIPEIDEMTRLTRKIGLGVMGWADLLFELDIAYDSDAALALGERMMSFIRDQADRASEQLADERGVFPAWQDSVYGPSGSDRPLRNSTRTTVAPTGTLSIIADCSGGIEPAFALAFTRRHFLDPRQPSKPVRLTEVNRVFEAAARHAGFWSEDLAAFLAAGGSLAERDDVPDQAKTTFVTAHEVEPAWHVRMQAAFQRHTDNAVSKTINFPHDATVEDVANAYQLAYREGCKGITIYRDGSRSGQVLSHAAASDADNGTEPGMAALLAVRQASPSGSALHRRRMPVERRSITHKFRVGEQEGFVTAGLFADGTPGEIFVTISKEGSTIRGLMDSVAMLTSYSLQYGVALRTLVEKFRGVHFEPAGFTSNPEIPQATSLVDYIFRWLELKFLQEQRAPNVVGAFRPPGVGTGQTAPPATIATTTKDIGTGLLCPDCGNQLVFAEGCLLCRNCGYSKCG